MKTLKKEASRIKDCSVVGTKSFWQNCYLKKFRCVCPAPGQIPTRIFNFTPEFKVYEKKLWAEVNNWLAINKPTKKAL